MAVVALALAGAPACAGDGTGLLDGQRFVGLNGEQGRALDPDEQEEIVFKDGLFHSVSCDPYRFGSSPYRALKIGDEIHFEAVTTSPTHGRIAWRGIVRGNQADVTFVWTKERWYWNTRKAYWFRGRLAP